MTVVRTRSYTGWNDVLVLYLSVCCCCDTACEETVRLRRDAPRRIIAAESERCSKRGRGSRRQAEETGREGKESSRRWWQEGMYSCEVRVRVQVRWGCRWRRRREGDGLGGRLDASDRGCAVGEMEDRW